MHLLIQNLTKFTDQKDINSCFFVQKKLTSESGMVSFGGALISGFTNNCYFTTAFGGCYFLNFTVGYFGIPPPPPPHPSSQISVGIHFPDIRRGGRSVSSIEVEERKFGNLSFCSNCITYFCHQL